MVQAASALVILAILCGAVTVAGEVLRFMSHDGTSLLARVRVVFMTVASTAAVCVLCLVFQHIEFVVC